MNIKSVLFSFLFLFLATFSLQAQQDYPFKNEILAFQKADSIKMPAKGGILFIGSSSIRRWNDLEKRFSDKPIIRRGVGGSQMSEWVDFYMPYLVYPYQPKKIFIFVGGNDIAKGKPAAEVFGNFKKFYTMVKDKLPNTKIYYLSTTNTPSRVQWAQQVTDYNQMVKDFAKSNKNLTYIDVDSSIQDANGQPREELFVKDKLHLNSDGYDKWEKVIRPNL